MSMDMSMDSAKGVKALSLLSGGLDSRLAICVLRDQGIEVHAVVFDSPFFNAESGREAAVALGVPLHVFDFTADILDLLNNPPHGFGSCMNPCIDCHARMLKRAGEMMLAMGFDFISTGEVLNQRPMSQNRRMLDVVARDSGYADFIVRPLSALLLTETKPERTGQLDRKRLLAIEGRGRKVQMQLAERYGLKDYPSPAGGCRLTEPNFSKRLKDLKDHEGLDCVRLIRLLRLGRHFRLSDGTKLIVGRNESDNNLLEQTAEAGDTLLIIEDIPGPVGLIMQVATDNQLREAVAVCARYSDAAKGDQVMVTAKSTWGEKSVRTLPAKAEDAEKLMI